MATPTLWRSSSRPHVLRRTMAAAVLLLLAACGRNVQGTVRDNEGHGVDDAWVLVSAVDPVTKAISPLRSTRSGPTGQFSLSGFDAGDYVIDAVRPDGDFDASEAEAAIVSGARWLGSPAGRAILSVGESQEPVISQTWNVDVRLGATSEDGARVRGRLTGALRQDERIYSIGATVSGASEHVSDCLQTICDDQGRFDLGYLPEGDVLIGVEDVFAAPLSRFELEPGDEVTVPIRLPYHGLVRITGSTADEEDRLGVRPENDRRFGFWTSADEAQLWLVEGDYLAELRGPSGEATARFSVLPGKTPAEVHVSR